MPFVPHTLEETQQMLSCIGVKKLDDLFAYIPQDMRPKQFDLPAGLTEDATITLFEGIANKNRKASASFLGAGFYDHYTPKAVDYLSGRGEFYTAYTPYQAEAAQGTLQAIFEYQTAVCRLLEMDVANASLYDGGSAVFEAAMMAVRATKRNKLVVDEAVNPIYRKMLATLAANIELEIVTVPHSVGIPQLERLKDAIDGSTAAVIVQNPTFFGNIFDYTELFKHAAQQKALSIMSVYPVMQAVLKTPREMGADITIAEGQSLGQPLGFGGPYLGILACTKTLDRQMPGRIVGRTTDIEGKTGYVLTLQPREQHIRRSKATSNICSNQALCALRCLIHLCLLGPVGLTRTAERSIELAHYAADKLSSLPQVTRFNSAHFGNEFALRLPVPAQKIVAKLAEQGILAGALPGQWYKDMENILLVACTEKNSEAQIDALAKAIGEAI